MSRWYIEDASRNHEEWSSGARTAWVISLRGQKRRRSSVVWLNNKRVKQSIQILTALFTLRGHVRLASDSHANKLDVITNACPKLMVWMFVRYSSSYSDHSTQELEAILEWEYFNVEEKIAPASISAQERRRDVRQPDVRTAKNTTFVLRQEQREVLSEAIFHTGVQFPLSLEAPRAEESQTRLAHVVTGHDRE
ncbi:hypothetical protein B0H11DRAFT_2332293 [Mycena galericulata]|nr:hypothetical protein B0H11DRAFT_2332293 [Mycena galericulata]